MWNSGSCRSEGITKQHVEMIQHDNINCNIIDNFIKFHEREMTKHAYVTVPKVIHKPRYNMKCSGDNVILRGIVHVVSGFHPHFMFYRGNLDCFSNRVALNVYLETLVKPV